MRSKKLLAAAITGVLAAGTAVAATFEGRLVCDQDPRYASSASCVLDSANGSESWDPVHLTYYSTAAAESESSSVSQLDALSEPILVTERYALGDAADAGANMAWAVDPDTAVYYLTDATTGNVIPIYSGGDTWMIVSVE